MTTETTATETTNPNPSTPSTLLTNSEPKLWAGKYKTPEDLEEGYKKISQTFEENQTLKKELERHTAVPESYEIPGDVVLRQAELEDLKIIAKNAGLTQDQFVKTAKDMQARIQYQIESFEQAKAELGEQKLNILSDYVAKHYPEKLREVVLKTIIKDKDAMTDAMKHRESVLNTSAPGIENGDPKKEQKYDGQKELTEAANAYHKNPHDKKARQRYIQLAGEVGNERFGGGRR